MVLYVSNASQHNINERRRISDFFEKFISYFFNIPMSQIVDSTKDVERVSVEDEYVFNFSKICNYADRSIGRKK